MLDCWLQMVLAHVIVHLFVPYFSGEVNCKHVIVQGGFVVRFLVDFVE